MCFLLCEVIVLDSLSQCRMEYTGVLGTRTDPVPGNGKPNLSGTRTVPVPGSGDPIYKVLEQNGSGTQVLDSESVGV